MDTASGLIDNEKKIRGFYKLTKDYSFTHVPCDAVVTSSLDSNKKTPKNCTVSNNYGAANGLVAIIQLCIACFTIVRSSSSEIHDNGYGSFSLTVVPYALMLFMNLLGLITYPLYPTLFMDSRRNGGGDGKRIRFRWRGWAACS